MNFRPTLLLSLFASFFCTSISMAQVPLFVPKEGLKGWWPLDGNAKDASQYGNNGELTMAVPATDRKQKESSALYFENNNSLIQIPDDPAIRVENAFSISLWVNIQSPSQTLIRKARTFGIDLGSSGGFSSGTNILFFMNDTRSGLFTSTASLPLATWLHLVGVYDGKTTSFYVNGQKIAGYGSLSGSVVNDNSPLTIGAWDYEQFQGSIDNVGLWNRGLTAEEVIRLYEENCGDFIADPVVPSNIALNREVKLSIPDGSSDDEYQWQTNPYDLGWQDLKDNKVFSGVTTKDLWIRKVTFQNHQQQFRLITSNVLCSDTSSVITLTLSDTCLSSVADTNWVTATDTLIIRTSITDYTTGEPVATLLKVFPNPANEILHVVNSQGEENRFTYVRMVSPTGEEVNNGRLFRELTFDLTKLSRGLVYTLEIREVTGALLSAKKILVE